MTVHVQEREIDLTIWDTAGQEEYTNQRCLVYNDASVFIACFSLDDAESLKALERKWLPELR